jgi:predicted transcriptional regulator
MKIGLLARATWDHAPTWTKCCSPATNVAAVAGFPWSGGCGAVPAGDSNQKLVGIVTDRDLCVALGEKDRHLPELGAGQSISRSVAICRFRVRQ